MRKSILLFVGFVVCVTCLAIAASAQCKSCGQEGDWGASASAFISGTPISDEPIVFGPKAARSDKALGNEKDKSASTDANLASDDETAKEAKKIVLKSIEANPAAVVSGESVKIIATFEDNSTSESKNANESNEDRFLTATTSIRNDSDAVVSKVNLVRASDNMYSGVWKASVPAGLYKVTLMASSLEASETFKDALTVEVTAPA